VDGASNSPATVDIGYLINNPVDIEKSSTFRKQAEKIESTPWCVSMFNSGEDYAGHPKDAGNGNPLDGKGFPSVNLNMLKGSHVYEIFF
jgi:hypothetical protein